MTSISKHELIEFRVKYLVWQNCKFSSTILRFIPNPGLEMSRSRMTCLIPRKRRHQYSLGADLSHWKPGIGERSSKSPARRYSRDESIIKLRGDPNSIPEIPCQFVRTSYHLQPALELFRETHPSNFLEQSSDGKMLSEGLSLEGCNFAKFVRGCIEYDAIFSSDRGWSRLPCFKRLLASVT